MGGGGKGGNNNGGGGSQASTANGAANGETAAPNNRGLDSGLAKSAPSAVGLNQRTYRAYRRRLDLFSPSVHAERKGHRHRGCLLGAFTAPRHGLGCNREHRL